MPRMARLLWGSSPVLLLLLCGLVFAGANLVQFGVIITYLTGRNGLLYNGYGCYCGWGGSKQPVDDTDWCCQVHDCCYQTLENRQCWPKAELYFFSLMKHDVTCVGLTKCQQDACECDRAAALCFRRSEFQLRYKFYPNKLCQGSTPSCQEALAHMKQG